MSEKANERLHYRLLTGTDGREFCERVSEAIASGYRLFGSPSVAIRGDEIITVQAVVLDKVNQ